MRICATGTDGYVGRHLARLDACSSPLGRDAGDVVDLERRILRIGPSAVIHLAAMSALADCAADPDEARRVNVEGTRAVARAARSCGSRLVFVSTDQVFDGRNAPYRESDPVCPTSHYGATKAEAETVARDEGGDDVLIVRLHLVVGPGVPPFRSNTDLFLDAVRRGDHPMLFEDEYRSPIHVCDAARALAELAGGGPTGVLHLGGPERLSRVEIGRALLAAAGLDESLARSGSIRDHRGPPRTPDTSYDVTLSRRTLRRPPRPIAEALRDPGS